MKDKIINFKTKLNKKELVELFNTNDNINNSKVNINNYLDRYLDNYLYTSYMINLSSKYKVDIILKDISSKKLFIPILSKFDKNLSNIDLNNIHDSEEDLIIPISLDNLPEFVKETSIAFSNYEDTLNSIPLPLGNNIELMKSLKKLIKRLDNEVFVYNIEIESISITLDSRIGVSFQYSKLANNTLSELGRMIKLGEEAKVLPIKEKVHFDIVKFIMETILNQDVLYDENYNFYAKYFSDYHLLFNVYKATLYILDLAVTDDYRDTLIDMENELCNTLYQAFDIMINANYSIKAIVENFTK